MRNILEALIGIAAVWLLLVVALGYGGPLAFDLDLLSNFRFHFLLASAAVAVLAALMRCRGALWRSVAAIVLAAAGLGSAWQEPAPATTVEGPAVTVMSANLYLWNTDPDAMRRALIAADPDILVTIETSRTGILGGQALAEKYPYSVVFANRTPDWLTALWSKYPIRDGRLVLRGRKGAPWGALAVVEVAPGHEVSVLGVHLQHTAKHGQRLQIEEIGRLAANLPRPLVVMGDFNAATWSYALHRVEALTGTEAVRGIGRTWHGVYPVPLVPLPEPIGLPLDHILVSPGIGVAAAGTVPIPGSDHSGVRATLRLPMASAPSAAGAPDISDQGRTEGDENAAGYPADRKDQPGAGRAVRRVSGNVRASLPRRRSVRQHARLRRCRRRAAREPGRGGCLARDRLAPRRL